MSGLYLHIPFCRQKCRYCDFASQAGAEHFIDAYLSAMDQEASFYAGEKFDTLYVGGGTPSVLSQRQLERLCEIIGRRFAPVSSFAESTLEANPESVDHNKLRLLKDAGFKRLSMGLQSWDDKVLRRIGRVHDVQTFLAAYAAARNAGFDNISVDLIAGLPDQREADFAAGLKRLLALGPEHVSVYGLQVEAGTPFDKEGVQTDEDLLRRELEHTHFALCEAGFEHYEISNFARAGRRSKHNVNYWRNGPYLGLGCAAASYQKGVRRTNTADLHAYLRRVEAGNTPTEFSECLRGKAKEGESVMLGLRLLEGTALTGLQRRLFEKEIEELVRRGLVAQEGDLIKLTFEGMFLANQAFMAFVGPFGEEECL